MTAVRDEKGRMVPGMTLNPGGKPKNARNRVVTAFLNDFADVWHEGGKAALQRLAIEDPASFVRAAVALVPKDVNVDVRDVTYDEAVRMLLNGGRAATGDADGAPVAVN